MNSMFSRQEQTGVHRLGVEAFRHPIHSYSPEDPTYRVTTWRMENVDDPSWFQKPAQLPLQKRKATVLTSCNPVCRFS